MAKYNVFRLDGQGSTVEANNHLEALQKCIHGYLHGNMIITEVNNGTANYIVQGARALKSYKVEKKPTEQDMITQNIPLICKAIRKIYDALETKYIPTDKSNLDNCADHLLTMWLGALLEYIAIKKHIKVSVIKKTLDEMVQKQKIVNPILLKKYLENSGELNVEKIQKVVDIRSDFDTALKNVKRGTELSSILGWGFSDADIKELAKLHKARKYRSKIESLLTDCNFHAECSDFANGNYDEYLK